MRVLIGLLLLICLSGVASQIVQPDANNTFHVTAGSSPPGYTIQNTNNPTLNMTVGKTYQISIEFDNTAHPFGLNTNQNSLVVSDMGLVAQTNANSACGGSATTGFTASSPPKPCWLTFTPQASTPQPLFYHCTVHSIMVGQIQTGTAGGSTGGGSTGGGSTGGSTTAPPSNGTTGAPTNPPQGGGASAVVPGVVAVVFAAITVAMTH